MRASPDSGDEPSRVRFDKWLWAARFYKTQPGSTGDRAGSGAYRRSARQGAHPVRVGERIVLRRAGLVWEILVVALSERRGSAPEAAKLYVEGPESVAAREAEIARRKVAAARVPVMDGRPTKRDRRKLQEFLDEA
jgi:ribosome-associated heat shock protein Hsp15